MHREMFGEMTYDMSTDMDDTYSAKARPFGSRFNTLRCPFLC